MTILIYVLLLLNILKVNKDELCDYLQIQLNDKIETNKHRKSDRNMVYSAGWF